MVLVLESSLFQVRRPTEASEVHGSVLVGHDAVGLAQGSRKVLVAVEALHLDGSAVVVAGCLDKVGHHRQSEESERASVSFQRTFS